jgi:DNA-binding GntR family transcriptional regulator
MRYRMRNHLSAPPLDAANHGSVGMPAAQIERLTDRRVLADRVYDILRGAILSSELKPGAALIERNLAERFGVSKSPVRDALQRLAGEGLVIPSSHRGMTVASISAKQADEIFELRELLEPPAVRQAVPVMTKADFLACRAAVGRASTAIRSGNLRLAINESRGFHDIFIARCNNHLLQETISRLHDRVSILSVVTWSEHPSDEQNAHVAILKAAEARDTQLAGRLMAAHIKATRQYLHDFYKAEPGIETTAKG